MSFDDSAWRLSLFFLQSFVVRLSHRVDYGEEEISDHEEDKFLKNPSQRACFLDV